MASRILKIRRASKTELFHRHLKLAYQQAHKFANQYNQPHYEMIDEALHALGKVVAEWDRFDPSMSRPITHIYHAIYWHLMKVCQPRKRKHTQIPVSTQDLDKNTRPSDSWYHRIWMDLGAEGRAFLKILLEAPGSLYHTLSPRAPVRSKRAILKYLRQNGWTNDRIEHAMCQVECCL